jgi:hypothetical protein
MPLRPVRELSTGRFVGMCVAAAVLALVGVTIAASPLPRITPDSASYLTGAERIARDNRFDSCTGPITIFAPGYSAVMAPLVALDLAAPDAARVVNALATLALVLGAAALARAAGLSRLVTVVAAFAVAVSYATLRDGALVWSEPSFCAILAWLLVLVVDSGRGLEVKLSGRVAGALVLTWALLLTRHSGLFLLPAVLLAAWLGSSRAGNRLLKTGLFGVALVAVPAVWWLRNRSIDDTLFGRRAGSQFDVLDVLDQLPDALSSLALPAATPYALRLAIFAPLLLAAVLAWRREAGPKVVVAVLTTAAAVYVGAVTVAATRTVVDALDTRLMSPIVAPVAVLVALGISPARDRLERVLAGFALGLVGLMAVLAPGVVWRGHTADRTLTAIPDDVSCVDWPARYSGTAVRPARHRG